MGHISLTISGTKYDFVVDPDSYSEVDIVDFAPRAVAGTPAFSEMGLYLEVAQLGFGHGFGRWTYSEPASYMYSGNCVDTSHDFISLYTDPVLLYETGSFILRKMWSHREVQLGCGLSGLYVVRASDLHKINASNWRYGISNGDYFFLTQSGRMQVGDLGDVKTAGGSTLTSDEDPQWTADIFNGGTVYIYDGLGAGQTRTVTNTTADTLTVSVAWGTGLNPTSKFIVWANAGVGGNPPNNFNKLAISGGYMWGGENRNPWLHSWVESDGTDAEGGQDTDTAAVRVGPGDFRIRNLLAAQNQLFAFRDDGMWAVGDDSVAYHTLDFGDQVHAYNFFSAVVWNGFTIFPIRRSLMKYRSGLQDMTPPPWTDRLPYLTFGEFRGMVPRGKYLYVLGQSNGSNAVDEAAETAGFVTLLKTDGVGWHKVATFPEVNPSDFDLWLDPAADRLYVFLYDTSGYDGHLYYVQLQTHSEMPYAAFPTSGAHNWYSSYFDLGMKRISKSYAEVLVEADFPANTSIDAYFRVDADAGWTSLGTFTASMTPLAFPAGTTGKRVQVKLNLLTTAAARTPAVKALIIKQMLRPSVLFGATMDVIVQDDLSRPDGRKLGMTADEIRTALKAGRDSIAPITFEDLWDTSTSAYISSLRFIVDAYAEEDAGIVESRARMTVVNV